MLPLISVGHSAQYILKRTIIWRLDAVQYSNPCVCELIHVTVRHAT